MDQLTEERDPLEILRAVDASAADKALSAALEDLQTAAEVRAAASARPTDGGEAVIRRARASGRTVAIVSNNSEAAVLAYLRRVGLVDSIDGWSAGCTPSRRG
ncbi:hypothetical protein GCM10010123_18320 [Pilimelia anulata]|uniref:Uncharacterized protein n=1 Tax=Pilimelia anulata TaxID=53371 RepID=A0A8J3F8Q6_9ACTN|nr:HAD family hydrolase [Pilimelia anulata]GGJ89089.1 hypothetical protein GCM10010123_18320 [Pilimelia anulata]